MILGFLVRNRSHSKIYTTTCHPSSLISARIQEWFRDRHRLPRCPPNSQVITPPTPMCLDFFRIIRQGRTYSSFQDSHKQNNRLKLILKPQVLPRTSPDVTELPINYEIILHNREKPFTFYKK